MDNCFDTDLASLVSIFSQSVERWHVFIFNNDGIWYWQKRKQKAIMKYFYWLQQQLCSSDHLSCLPQGLSVKFIPILTFEIFLKRY